MTSSTEEGFPTEKLHAHAYPETPKYPACLLACFPRTSTKVWGPHDSLTPELKNTDSSRYLGLN